VSGAIGGRGIDYGLLFGAAGAATGSGGNPASALALAERNQAKDIAQIAKQPQAARAIATFTAAVAAAKDPATLLRNPQVLDVLLTANGLGDQSSYTALASKALLSDPSDPKSLAARLPDTRWKAVAATFQFATKGLAILKDPKVLATVASGYAEVMWRQSLDVTTPGLSNALDFKARIGKAKTADDILGDATFRAVVTTALGIPAQIAYQGLPAQERAITSHLDMARLSSPKYVDGLTQRYLSAKAASAGGNAPGLDALAVQNAGLLV